MDTETFKLNLVSMEEGYQVLHVFASPESAGQQGAHTLLKGSKMHYEENDKANKDNVMIWKFGEHWILLFI